MSREAVSTHAARAVAVLALACTWPAVLVEARAADAPPTAQAAKSCGTRTDPVMSGSTRLSASGVSCRTGWSVYRAWNATGDKERPRPGWRCRVVSGAPNSGDVASVTCRRARGGRVHWRYLD